MRSEGFPFIVGGVGVGAVFAWLASSRRLSSSLVVCRRLSSFVVVVASQICCHWGKLLQVTFHGRVTCQFAPLFHCDLRQVSAEMAILVDGSVLRTGRNHSKRVVRCKFC